MLYGFDKRAKEFKDLSAAGCLAQSHIFYGDPQIGKTAFARGLAFFLETGEFAASSKILSDFLEIWPEEEKEEIGIDAVRRLKHFLSETPLVSLRRSVIVPEAERLTIEAQAALLKIVEEPPAEALIVLVLPNPDFLAPALVSRCQKTYFPRLAQAELERILCKEYKAVPIEAKKTAAESFGRLGRALGILGYNEKKQGGPAEYFESKIVAGFKKLPGSITKMEWLLEREAALKRLNLNTGLQQRAAEQFMNN